MFSSLSIFKNFQKQLLYKKLKISDLNMAYILCYNLIFFYLNNFEKNFKEVKYTLKPFKKIIKFSAQL